MIGKIIAGVIVGGLLLSWFGPWVLLIPAVLLLLWLIRKIADMFWWGRDKGRW